MRGGSRKKGLFLAGLGSAAMGAAAAAVFSFYQFTREGGCGFVRFYEHAFGAAVLGLWLLGIAAGLILLLAGRGRSPSLTAFGCTILAAVNAGMILMAMGLVRDVREADFTIKGPDRLLTLAAGSNGHQAIHELGRRREKRAVALLCEVLDDGKKDVNLRLNAAGALGRICEAHRAGGEDEARSTASLVRALADRSPYLRRASAESLWIIGGAGAVGPLIRTLSGKEETLYVKEAAAIALCRIGDPRGIEPVRNHLNRDEVRNHGSRYTIGKAFGEFIERVKAE